jgi:hypothetical protein
MKYLRQSTASQEILLGPFVDSTDGDTEETGLTIAASDIEIYKSGATTHVDKASGGATHSSKGMYSAVLDASDTDTIGAGRIYVHVSGALPVLFDFVVLDEAVFDVLFGTTAPSTLAAGALMGLADEAITASKIAASAIGASEAPLLAHLDADISSRSTYAGGDTSGVTTLLSRIVGTLASGTHNPQSGDAYDRIGAPAGASVSADIAALVAGILAGVIEGSITLQGALRLTLAALVGKDSGAPDGPITFRDTEDTTDRIIATVDEDGNRTDVDLDAS